MLNNETIAKVYNKFLVTNKITIRELMELGLKSKDIKKLVLLNYISMDEVGNYIISDVELLYSYGKELLDAGLVDKAFQIFTRCYELDNTYEDVVYDLYFKSLDDKNYKDSFTYFDQLNIGKSR